MLTAIRAVDNILTGAEHDIWAVNAESVYHEEASRTSTLQAGSRDALDARAARLRVTLVNTRPRVRWLMRPGGREVPRRIRGDGGSHRGRRFSFRAGVCPRHVRARAGARAEPDAEEARAPSAAEERGRRGQAGMSELEEGDPPKDLADWPAARRSTSPTAAPTAGELRRRRHLEARPSSLRHHEDGSVTIEGEEVDDPDEYKGEPIPGGPSDPDAPPDPRWWARRTRTSPTTPPTPTTTRRRRRDASPADLQRR